MFSNLARAFKIIDYSRYTGKKPSEHCGLPMIGRLFLGIECYIVIGSIQTRIRNMVLSVSDCEF